MANYLDDSYGTLGKNLITEQATNCPWTPTMGNADPFGVAITDICANSQFQGFGGTCSYVGKINMSTNPWWNTGLGSCPDQTKPCIGYNTVSNKFRIHDPTNFLNAGNPCDVGCDWGTALGSSQGNLTFQAYECYNGGPGSCIGKCDGVNGTNIYNDSAACALACTATLPDQDIGCADPNASNYGSANQTPPLGIVSGMLVQLIQVEWSQTVDNRERQQFN